MRRWIIIAIAVGILVVVPQILIESEIYARVISVAGICLLLWMSEAVPPFIPTLLLWVLIPLSLGSFDSRYSLSSVLTWAMDPVIALFFGAFLLGVALEQSGWGHRLSTLGLRASGHSYFKFL